MNDWLPKTLYDAAIKHLHKWYGLCALLLLVFICGLSVNSLIPHHLQFQWVLLVLSVAELFTFLLWYFNLYRYPRCSSGKLGVVIALHVEGVDDANLFKKDFIVPFKEKVSALGLPFDVLVLRNSRSEEIDTEQSAQTVLKKTRAHFIVWGSLKKRRDYGEKNQYIFSFRAMVVHSPISEAQKVLLTSDFSAILPHKVAFEESLQYVMFDFGAGQLFAAVDYILGRAALLSGDIDTAIKLHRGLYNQIKSGLVTRLNLGAFEKLLSNEYFLLSNIFFMKAQQEVTADFVNAVSNSLRFNKGNYAALLYQAIVDFNDGKGDPKKALSTLVKAKDSGAKNKEWLHSKIFLHLWMKQYKKALAECLRVERRSIPDDVQLAQQVCGFCEQILIKFPDKIQIYFWLGFLNYIKLNNLGVADSMFQLFLDQAGGDESVLIVKASGYLEEIRKQIGY